MEQRCKYGLTLRECNKKWEAPCQNDDCECSITNSNRKLNNYIN